MSVKKILVQDVIDAIDGVATASGKATNVFRAYVGFPSAKPEAMEASYQVVLDACKGDTDDAKRRNTALRVLMCECRKLCNKPYAKNKKGEIVARTDKPKSTGAVHKVSDAEPVQVREVIKEVPIPMGELEILDRFAELATAYLVKAEDVATASRIIAAIRFNWGKVTRKAKTTRK